MTMASSPTHVTFSPGLASAEASANYWMQQVTIRLRREICWHWQERTGAPAPAPTALPPVGDRLGESLDLTRYWDAKRAFFVTDTTASYLSELLHAAPPTLEVAPGRGAFRWVVETLRLNAVSTFTLALGLTACFDSAVGP